VEADTCAMRHTYNFSDAILAPMNPKHGPEVDGNDNCPLDGAPVRVRFCPDPAAVSAGAHLYEEHTVRDLQVIGGTQINVTAVADGLERELCCDYVVGADGANGIVGRTVGAHKAIPGNRHRSGSAAYVGAGIRI